MRKPCDHALLLALASELKSRRLTMGISQDELALRANLNRTFVAKIEVAKTQPALISVFHLAEALKVNPGDFVNAIWSRYRVEVSRVIE
jgi:predicted transcriptional regulator